MGAIEKEEADAIKLLLRAHKGLDSRLILKAIEADQKANAALKAAVDTLKVQAAILQQAINHIKSETPVEKSAGALAELEKSKGLIIVAQKRVEAEFKRIEQYLNG